MGGMSRLSPVAQVKLLSPKPGDVIVVTLPEDVTGALFGEFVEASRESFKETFPENKVVFLGGGVELDVRPEGLA